MWSGGQGEHETPIFDPLVIGHECSGVVTAVASDVTHLKVGQYASSGQLSLIIRHNNIDGEDGVKRSRRCCCC